MHYSTGFSASHLRCTARVMPEQLRWIAGQFHMRQAPHSHLKQAGERKHDISGKFSEEEASFAAVSNARVVKDAEEYYRSMFFAGDDAQALDGAPIPRTALNVYCTLLPPQGASRRRPVLLCMPHRLCISQHSCLPLLLPDQSRTLMRCVSRAPAENLTWNIRDKHMAETAVHLSGEISGGCNLL